MGSFTLLRARQCNMCLSFQFAVTVSHFDINTLFSMTYAVTARSAALSHCRHTVTAILHLGLDREDATTSLPSGHPRQLSTRADSARQMSAAPARQTNVRTRVSTDKCPKLPLCSPCLLNAETHPVQANRVSIQVNRKVRPAETALHNN